MMLFVPNNLYDLFGIPFNLIKLTLRKHWRLLTLKNKQQNCMNVFWYIKVYIFWKLIHYIIHWDKTQMLKKFLWQNTRYKSCIIFSFASSNSSVLFLIRSSYTTWIKHMVHLSKTVCGSLHFRFHLVFIKHFIVCSTKAWTLSLQNVIVPFKIKIIEKPHTDFFENSVISAWVGSS